jgi:hypothetical protein
VGLPFYNVKSINIPFKRSALECSDCLVSLRSLFAKGWYPHEIFVPHKTTKESLGSEDNPWFCGTHFKITRARKYEELRLKNKQTLSFLENSDNSASKNYLPEIISPSDDLKAKINNKTNKLESTGKGVQSDAWIEWNLNKKSYHGPSSGVDYIIVFTFLSRPKSPSDFANLKNNKVHSHLATQAGTQNLSPLGKVLLTAEEILRPEDEWDTLVKFSIKDRVDEFVPISADSPNLKVIRKLLGLRNPELRLSMADINLERKEFFLPYTKFLKQNYRDEKFLSLLTGVIQHELFLKKWTHMPPPTPRRGGGRPKKLK